PPSYFASSHEPLVLHAFTDDGTPTTIVEANAAAARLLGTSPEALAGRSLFELLTGDAPLDESRITASFRTGTPVTLRLSARDPYGADLRVDATLHPLCTPVPTMLVALAAPAAAP